jgi:hypothetical protein
MNPSTLEQNYFSEFCQVRNQAMRFTAFGFNIKALSNIIIKFAYENSQKFSIQSHSRRGFLWHVIPLVFNARCI